MAASGFTGMYFVLVITYQCCSPIFIVPTR